MHHHLDGAALRALLATCRAVARSVVQQAPLALRRGDDTTPTWPPHLVHLLARDWAPPDLHLTLEAAPAPALPTTTSSNALTRTPVLVLARVTVLHLHGLTLTRVALDSLQHCQRLHTLTLVACMFVDDAPASSDWPPALDSAAAAGPPLRALPHLYSLSVLAPSPPTPPAWASAALLALAARATCLRVRAAPTLVLQALGALRELVDVGVEPCVDLPMLRALGDHPAVESVQTPALSTLHAATRATAATATAKQQQDRRQQQAGGLHELALDELSVRQWCQVPLLARVESLTVRRRLAWDGGCGGSGGGSGSVARALQQMAPRLTVEVHVPPDAACVRAWGLTSPQERLRGCFELRPDVERGLTRGVGVHVRRLVLPSDGGPRTLVLDLSAGGWGDEDEGEEEEEQDESEEEWEEDEDDEGGEGSYAQRAVRWVAPLLAGTNVRTLCLELGDGEEEDEPVDLSGVLQLLPSSVTHLSVAQWEWFDFEQAVELLQAPLAPRREPLRVTLVERCGEEEQVGGVPPDVLDDLADLCGRHEPPVQLCILLMSADAKGEEGEEGAGEVEGAPEGG